MDDLFTNTFSELLSMISDMYNKINNMITIGIVILVILVFAMLIYIDKK